MPSADGQATPGAALSDLLQRMKVRARKSFIGRTELEIKAKEATNINPWGPSQDVLDDLAECGKGEGALQEIGPVILQRLGRNGDQWPQAYKALVLAEHLVLHSDPSWSIWVHNEAVEAVQALQYFQYVDSDGEDWGSRVRSKARHFIKHLRNMERQSSARLMSRASLVSVGSGGVAVR